MKLKRSRFSSKSENCLRMMFMNKHSMWLRQKLNSKQTLISAMSPQTVVILSSIKLNNSKLTLESNLLKIKMFSEDWSLKETLLKLKLIMLIKLKLILWLLINSLLWLMLNLLLKRLNKKSSAYTNYALFNLNSWVTNISLRVVTAVQSCVTCMSMYYGIMLVGTNLLVIAKAIIIACYY